MTGERTKLYVPKHTANCVVEQDGKLEKVTAELAPKISLQGREGRKDLGQPEERRRAGVDPVPRCKPPPNSPTPWACFTGTWSAP